MTHDEVLDELSTRLPGLAALAAGTGDPLDLAGALVPGTPPDLIASAVATVERSAALTLLEVDGADDRTDRLAFAVAVSRYQGLFDDDRPWTDALDDLTYDVSARPQAYRDLSPWALALGAALDMAEGTEAGRLVQRVARAAIDAPAPETIDAARAVMLRMRRSSRLRRWRGWLAQQVDAALRPLRDAVDQVAAGGLPAAAATDVSAALARVRLGDALGGEVTVAVLPEGLVLEWDGDGAPPTEALAGGEVLEPTLGTAPATWVLPAPDEGPLPIELRRGDGKAAWAWGA